MGVDEPQRGKSLKLGDAEKLGDGKRVAAVSAVMDTHNKGTNIFAKKDS